MKLPKVKMKIKLILLCLSFVLVTDLLFGQQNNIYIKKQIADWETLSKQIEKENNIRFFYESDSLSNISIEVNQDSILLDEILKDTFSRYGVTVFKDGNGNYFLFKEFSLRSNLDKIFYKDKTLPDETGTGEAIIYAKSGGEYLKTYQDFIEESIVIGTNGNGKKNGKVKISGFVTHALDGDPIPQAYLNIKEKGRFETTNSLGYYEILIEPGNYTLSVNSLGMYEKTFKLTVVSSGNLDIPLKVKSFMINEAVVTANQDHNVRSTNMGFEKISAKAIKELPAIFGERDIVKVALLLPGVQSIGEVSSGFNVRGSPADQNIFYINGLPVYNSSHLYGLFTTFNSDAINEFNFYKSNIPIEYGGFLSSIFDINAKEGNNQYVTARGGIGLTSGRILIEGPIVKNNSSFLISVRSTYSDWILKQIENVDIQNSSASFYDGLMNFSLNLTKSNSVDLFLYGSQDYADLAFGIKNQYTNMGGSLKWTHIFSKIFVSELDFIKSQYAYSEENYEIEYLSNKHSFDLNHNEAKLGFRYYPTSKHSVIFGINSLYYTLNYGDFEPLNKESLIVPIVFEPEKAWLNSAFIGDKWDITPKFTVEAGIRGTYYNFLGPKNVYTYEKSMPKEIENIIDTTYYENNESVANYKNLDFKLSGKYEFVNNFSIKASYNRLHQYAFMLSSSISVSPTSKWKLSDSHIKPMVGEQYSFGLYKNLWDDKIETSVEVYYKDIENLVEYKDGTDFLTNQVPETNIIQGNLKAYGIELMIKKKMGKLNGWINYTYSKAEVQAINSETGEMNNQGLTYPANYDRPHALNLTMNYKLSKRLSISANVVYSTGRPVTYPSSIYYQNDIQITGFSLRNEYRLPDYFRTDLSINIEGNLKKYKFVHSSWSISFYNLTSRNNPYSLIFQNEDGKIKGYEVSILGTIIPSITYNLKFGNYEN
jgi:hypothetical protein